MEDRFAFFRRGDRDPSRDLGPDVVANFTAEFGASTPIYRQYLHDPSLAVEPGPLADEPGKFPFLTCLFLEAAQRFVKFMVVFEEHIKCLEVVQALWTAFSDSIPRCDARSAEVV